MALIPDIAAHGLSFMHFFFHMEGGFESVEDFWRQREVPTVEWAGLSYYEVLGLSHALTASIQWRRVAKDCCDVRLALDAMDAKSLGFPEDKQYQINETTFREFFDFARQQEVGGILARYGATLLGELHFLELPGNARLKRFVIEAGDKPSTITADFSRDAAGRWTVTLEPERLLHFLDKPVDDEFFEAPLKAATILVTPLITGTSDEKRATP
jgi:hypothetical protein